MSLGSLMKQLNNNIKMNVRSVACKGMKWREVDQNRVQSRGLNCIVPKNQTISC
jgi:hypothetical protein